MGWQVAVARHRMNVTMKEKLEILNFAGKFGRQGSFNPAVKLLFQQFCSPKRREINFYTKAFPVISAQLPWPELSSRSSLRAVPAGWMEPVARGALSGAALGQRPCRPGRGRAQEQPRGGGMCCGAAPRAALSRPVPPRR